MMFPRPISWVRRAAVAALLGISWMIPAPAAGAAGPAVTATDTRAPGEAALLGRLVAPCCWTQTLDVHGGAAPDGFRAEIHARLLAGEAPKSIEDDFVSRYGKAVLAEPKDSPLPFVTLGLGVAAVAAAALLAAALRRWVRRGSAGGREAAPALPAAPIQGKDAWDERLDDELRAMDG
jgi:cytochrome c-type biogenesis protein CcmH